MRFPRPTLLAVAPAALILAADLSAQQTPGAAADSVAVASIEITPARTFVTVGQPVKFSAVAKDSAGRPVNTTIIYAASPFDVAFAEPDGSIRTFRQGTAIVIALAGGKVAQASLTVGPKPVSSIEIEPVTPAVVVGGVTTVKAAALTEDREPLGETRVSFRTLDASIATVDAAGVVTGRAPGTARIVAESGAVRGETRVRVVANPVARLEVEGPSTARTGDVLRFAVRAVDARGRPVADPPVRWSVSGESGDAYPDGAFVAEKPGTYLVSASVGGITGTAAVAVSQRTHTRKLERVHHRLLGDLQTAEHWAIANALYVSTVGDRLYTFDITNPAAPTLVDSLVVDARHINDVSTTADGRIGVITRENAASRRNGIVFLDLSDPLRPKVLSEYTATVTGGVHSAFIEGHHVYLTDDATGSLRVIDFGDAKNPREVARSEVPGVRGPAAIRDTTTGGGGVIGASVGRYLHDLQVKDGLAYLAYWRDGLVVLDVGNGIKGGSPESPRLVSRFTYNVGEYYPPDRVAGTHTAFRYRNYVFVGDEVFPATFNVGARDRIEALGRVHVVDVSDIEKPRKVADYVVPGGAHNLWVLDDVLYLGAYEGGIRALDVSGELRGDLTAQGREIGAIWTGDPNGFRPNVPFAWGAQPHRGLIYATDMNTGLWVARLGPAVVP